MKVQVFAVMALTVSSVGCAAVGCGESSMPERVVPQAHTVVAVPKAPFAFHDRTFLETWPLRSEVERAQRAAIKEEREKERAQERARERKLTPPCPSMPAPHFATPEQAMTYLASAWNRRDYAQECQVTNRPARLQLEQMRHEAVNLRLTRCEKVAVGLYGCIFRHDYPTHMRDAHGRGHAYLQVGAARNPGWYVTGEAVGCG